jgi:hypothetical protein
MFAFLPGVYVSGVDVMSAPTNKVCTGLVWPEKGHPAYYCVIGEKIQSKTESFDIGKPILEILHEGEAHTFTELTAALNGIPKHYTGRIYTLLEPRFVNFVRDFTRWKRDSGRDCRLIGTKSVSFEASVLKIKELVKEKRINLPVTSKIRSQLASFSKENLSDEVIFYAVRSLAFTVWAFDSKRGGDGVETEPKLKSWW